VELDGVLDISLYLQQDQQQRREHAIWPMIIIMFWLILANLKQFMSYFGFIIHTLLLFNVFYIVKQSRTIWRHHLSDSKHHCLII